MHFVLYTYCKKCYNIPGLILILYNPKRSLKCSVIRRLRNNFEFDHPKNVLQPRQSCNCHVSSTIQKGAVSKNTVPHYSSIATIFHRSLMPGFTAGASKTVCLGSNTFKFGIMRQPRDSLGSNIFKLKWDQLTHELETS